MAKYIVTCTPLDVIDLDDDQDTLEMVSVHGSLRAANEFARERRDLSNMDWLVLKVEPIAIHKQRVMTPRGGRS